jgi:hypothetical protein
MCALSVTGNAFAQKKSEPAPAKTHVPDLSRDFVTELRLPDETLGKRSTKLLVAELQGLERLLRTTPRNSPERPRLLLRLAEGYAELAAIKQREKIIAQERARREGDSKKAR